MKFNINEYKRKVITAEKAAEMVKSGDTVDLYGYMSSGQALDKALSKRTSELTNVKIRTMYRFGPGWQVFAADPEGKSFYNESVFVGPNELKQVRPENRAAIPSLFYEWPKLYDRGEWAADFGSMQVSSPDSDGYLHFSLATAYAKSFAKGVKCFIAEINTNLFPLPNEHPDAKIHISEVDYIIEGDNPPLFEYKIGEVAGETDQTIAKYIFNELKDGCCFQIGNGNLPSAVISLIAKSELKDLGIHSELFSDGLMRLYQAGRVNGKYKNIDRGKMTSTIIAGTNECYDFVRENKDVYIAPVDYVNDPYVIGQIDNLISINTCLELDITGQVNSETIGSMQIAGTGGQLDFMLGAYRSKNGKSIVCCPSTYTKKDGTRGSKIHAVLPAGVGISDPRAAVQYVCTEYGIVNIKGKSMWDRAELLISIAHPDYRDELIKEADKYGIWKHCNKR